MRVTSNTFPDTLMYQLQQLSGKMTSLQEQTSSGQRVKNPSDDPSATSRILSMQEEQSRLSQYNQNADNANNINQSSITEVQNLLKSSDRAGEITTLANGVTTPDALNSYAQEVNQMIEQSTQSLNQTFNGNPLFGGTGGTASQPFAVTRDANGDITGVTYQGTASGPSYYIADNAKISPYTDGTTNQKLGDFVNNLITLRDALKSGNKTTLQSVQTNLTNSGTDLTLTLSSLGSVQGRIQLDQNQNQSRYTDLSTNISNDANVDLSQSVVQLTQVQNAYQAALMSAGKVLNTSLLDYLK